MNKLIERIKDILHDSIDIILVVVIFLAVAGTILWRLDILFATDMDMPTINQPVDSGEAHDDGPIDSPIDSNDNSSPIPDESSSDQDNTDTDTDTDDNNDSDNSDGDTNDVDVDNNDPIIVVIPYGSLAPDIGQIIQELGLIQPEEYWTFLSRAQELKLDTKFQSGTFKIKEGASLDTIIKTISRSL